MSLASSFDRRTARPHSTTSLLDRALLSEAESVSEVRRPHGIRGGTLFRDDGTQRGHSVRCSCGWESELSRTLVLAEASGEQHVEFHRPRRPTSPR